MENLEREFPIIISILYISILVGLFFYHPNPFFGTTCAGY